MIRTYHGPELDHLELGGAAGLYIAQSRAQQRFFRVGESLDLLRRRRLHASAPAGNRRRPPNWTEVFRQWDFCWAALVPAATRVCLRMCENHLTGQLAQHYRFLDPSGFEAEPDAASRIIVLAEAALPALETIAAVQTGEFFDKNAHWAARQ